MEVTELFINNTFVPITDKPIGLEVIKISLDRDFQFSCIDTKIEVELSFFCASGKTQIDNEFENKGVEGSGYVIIVDTCGSKNYSYKFILDFKTYKNQGDYTVLGLIEENSVWKNDLNKEINLTNIYAPEDFYVRNLPLTYEYHLEKSEVSEKLQAVRTDLIWSPLPPFIVDRVFLFQKAVTTKNELENGSELLTNIVVGGDTYSYLSPANSVVASSASFATSWGNTIMPTVEIEPLFENILDDGNITIVSSGDNGLSITMNDSEYAFQYGGLREHILIGTAYDNPRINMFYQMTGGIMVAPITNFTPATYTANYVTGSDTSNYNSAYTGLTGQEINVKKGEKVWHFYSFASQGISPASPTIVNGILYAAGTRIHFINYKDIEIKIDRNIDIVFTLTKNVSNSISTVADIEPYHSKIKAYQGIEFLNYIFGTKYNICNTDCFNDLWFSRGDYVRSKVNLADFIVKPSDLFRELEKVVCCGLGYTYKSNTLGDRILGSVYDFYTDELVPSKYQFGYNDLIDNKIELAPFLAPYYKEIEIGYSNYKDNPSDFCKSNKYSVNNISDSIYSKISDIIASAYTITTAIRKGTEDSELEFDKNIFIFSGDTVSGGGSTYNVTLSQTSGFLQDNTIIQPSNFLGINRRYSTVFNLFRHLYKWGFSLFSDKDKMTVVKYEGNSIYDNSIRDTSTGMPTTPAPNKAANYFSLSSCFLPYLKYGKFDKSLSNIYTDFFKKDIYIPTQITFKTGNLSSLDLIEMRANQYDLFSVSDGTNTYYGNLISANLQDDITEIKLLRRFKNGI